MCHGGGSDLHRKGEFASGQESILFRCSYAFRSAHLPFLSLEISASPRCPKARCGPQCRIVPMSLAVTPHRCVWVAARRRQADRRPAIWAILRSERVLGSRLPVRRLPQRSSAFLRGIDECVPGRGHLSTWASMVPERGLSAVVSAIEGHWIDSPAPGCRRFTMASNPGTGSRCCY